ncbi:MAG: glycerol-3-phosphate acyltransferase [Candidatus Kapabacteria bacterium]|nr:glycerol-3-phosphate acyltransferase [Candidatus Kapabacteria bacterium]
MNLMIIIVLTYLIGTIPTSYLVVKFRKGINIFESGSGNPGALNSYESTGSKRIGIIVLLLDVLKGVLAGWLSYKISGQDYLPFMAGLIWVIIGHNYNIFFGGRGGRGLATAAGAFGIVNPFIVLTWLVMWAFGYYVIQKNVHIANAIALIGAPILIFSTPAAMFGITQILPVPDVMALKITFALACFVIILRHIKPIKDFVGIEEK